MNRANGPCDDAREGRTFRVADNECTNCGDNVFYAQRYLSMLRPLQKVYVFALKFS
jgi:hypothetical protein